MRNKYVLTQNLFVKRHLYCIPDNFLMLCIMSIGKHFCGLLTGRANHKQAQANTSCFTGHSTIRVQNILDVLAYFLICCT